MVAASQWGLGRIKWDTSMAAGSTPSTDEEGLWLDGDDPRGMPFVAIADMSRRERVAATTKSLSPEGLASRGMPIGKPGTLLFAMYASVGEVAFLDCVATWNQALLGITPNPAQVDPRFLRYVLLDMRDDLLRDVRSNTQANLNAGQVGNIWFQRPALEEQRAIADYLDRETARIDTLIEEQQCLIEMLRERRQAAVDATFAELDSERVQLRRFINFLTSGSRGWGSFYADEGDRFLRIGNLPRANLRIGGEVRFVDLPPGVSEGSRTVLHQDDLLFSITAYLGSVAVVDEEWEGSYVSQHVALCRLDSDRVHPRYIGWFMLTTTGQDQLNEGAAGGTKMQLTLDDIRELRVPVGPIDEQRGIAASIEGQTERIDELIAESERFIELSRERWAALITAAVTGQIDVREVA